MLIDAIRGIMRGEGVDLPSLLMQLLATVAVIFLILPLHEYAHGLIAYKLGVSSGSPAICLTSRTRADGHVAIYTREYLSYRIVKNYNLPPLNEITDEIFQFLKKYCGTEIDFVLSELSPAVADDEDSRLLEIEKGTPYQILEEVAYNKEGERILWTIEKYLPQYLHYTILRKKSLNSLD